MRFFDSHVHLDVMSDAARSEGVESGHVYHALVPGIEPAATATFVGRESAGVRSETIHYAAALHPWYLGVSPEEDPRWEQVRALASDPRICAVGETGLDHYRHPSAERGRVELWFRAHVALAVEVDKPLVIHCVRAHADCLRVLGELTPRRGGVVHAFSGSPEEAARYRGLGFLVGIGAAVTRERSTRVRRAATTVPAEQLLIESDAPYMAVDERGRDQGVPADIVRVCETVAALRGASSEDIAELTYGNACSLFGVSDSA